MKVKDFKSTPMSFIQTSWMDLLLWIWNPSPNPYIQMQLKELFLHLLLSLFQEKDDVHEGKGLNLYSQCSDHAHRAFP